MVVRARMSLISCRPTAPPPVRFVSRSRGACSSTTEGREYLDFLSGIAVTSLGHAHPAVAGARSAEQARDAAARLEPVRERARTRRSPRLIDTLDRRRHAGSAGRSSSPTPAPRRTSARSSSPGASAAAAATPSSRRTARSTAARSRRCTRPASPHKHEAVRAAARRGSATSPTATSTRSSGAIDPERSAAVLLEVIEGEGGVVAAAARLPRRGAPALRRAADLADDRRRGPDRPRAHRALVRASSTRASCPTS